MPNYRIATGDIDGAIDDIISCKTVRAPRWDQRGILVQILVGLAIEEIADRIGIAGSIEHPPLKGDSSGGLSTRRPTFLPKPTSRNAFQLELYMALDAMQGDGPWSGFLKSMGFMSFPL